MTKPKLKFVRRVGEYYEWEPANDAMRDLMKDAGGDGSGACAHVEWFWRGKHRAWEIQDAAMLRDWKNGRPRYE